MDDNLPVLQAELESQRRLIEELTECLRLILKLSSVAEVEELFTKMHPDTENPITNARVMLEKLLDK